MNPEITQFDIYYSIEATYYNNLKRKKKKKLMLIYEIQILDIALINFIMIVNINSCDFSIIVGVSLVYVLGIYNHISLSEVIVINS